MEVQRKDVSWYSHHGKRVKSITPNTNNLGLAIMRFICDTLFCSAVVVSKLDETNCILVQLDETLHITL